MAEDNTITITIDAKVHPVIQELLDGKAHPEVYKRLSDRVEEFSYFFRLDTENAPALGADKVWVLFNPTEALLELVAAVAG